MTSMLIGLYLPDMPDQWESLARWEELLDAKIDIVSIFQAWGSQYADFNTSQIKRIQQAGKIPLITWEPWAMPKKGVPPEIQPEYRLKSILSGKFDVYLESWATEISQLKERLLLRPMHEMNGDWYPWCGTVNGNKAGDYVEAWKYIYEFLGSRVPVDIVQWVWSPYSSSYPDKDENAMANYFPGDDYVDWVALDGYNWGSCQSGSSWQSFSEIFMPAYNEAIRLSNKPVLIGETACSEKGGNKAAWISDAFKMTQGLSRIKGIVWFNTEKECDWQIDSTQAALDSFRSAIG